MMKQYKYVHLHIDKFLGTKSKEHLQIIDESVKKLPLCWLYSHKYYRF